MFNTQCPRVSGSSRCKILFISLLATFLALLLLPIGPAVAVTGDAVLCSANASGAEGNSPSSDCATSAGGRFVAFNSSASNLVPGGTTLGRVNVFRKDLLTGEVLLCSADSSGVEGDNDCKRPSISADGRYVAFESEAANLVPGTTVGRRHIFRKDLQTGDILLCSADAAGVEGNNISLTNSISADGRYIAFGSDATNLVPGGTTPGIPNVFRKDCNTASVVLCSADSAGSEGNLDSLFPSISMDGRFIAFGSQATNLVPGGTTQGNSNVFRKDLQTAGVLLCSSDVTGVEGDDFSGNPSLSRDGRYVAFESRASNLVPGTTVGRKSIFRKDLDTAGIVLCSADSAGNEGNDASSDPSISLGGRFVAFDSDATNLVPGGTTPGQSNIFRKDLRFGGVALCSADSAGAEGNNDSYRASISHQGDFVAFVSYADDLIPGGTTAGIDNIFRKELDTIPVSTHYFFAEGTCRPNFETYFCIQNPTTTDADVLMTYMKGDGTVQTNTLTVPHDSRYTVNAKDHIGEGDDPAHDISTRVETTNNVDIIVERPMYFNYREGVPGYSWTGGHIAMGLPSPRRDFYFAEGTTRDNIHDGSYEEWLCIQNPSTTDTATVDITYMLETGETILETVTVNPTTRETIEVNAHVGENHDVSALLESDRPVVAERPMYFDYRNKWTGGHNVMGAPGPDTTFYFAEGTTRKNPTDGYFEEWITIQNPNTAAVNVNITYYTEQAGVVTQNVAVGATSRSTVDVWLALGDDIDTSFMIEADQPILVERPMYFDYHNIYRGGHDVMGCAFPHSVFFLAEGTCRPNFDPYLCIQNPEATDADVTITYIKGDGTTEAQDVTVPAQSRYTVVVKDQLGEGDTPTYDFSSRVECTSGQNIVVERPMYFTYDYMWTGGHDTLGI